MAGSHAVVARYDLLAKDVLDSGCIFIGDDNRHATWTPPVAVTRRRGQPSQDASAAADRFARTRATAAGHALPEVTIPPWDGKERLNILLIGADQRPSEGTFNTDTLIVVSIDPVTQKVAMFSLPRDTVDVPIPPGRRATLRAALHAQDQRLVDLDPPPLRPLPGQQEDARGINGLKEILGNLYKLDIKYFVEVNFDGFR